MSLSIYIELVILNKDSIFSFMPRALKLNLFMNERQLIPIRQS